MPAHSASEDARERAVVAGIHVLLSRRKEGVDARHKATAVRYVLCLMECTALILLDSSWLRIIWTRKRSNAVRHQNSVFHDIVKLIPWAVFDSLVEKHGADELVRTFKTRHQMIALLFGQLGGANSLRAIEAMMASHKARLYHVGGKVPARSTFADANRSRSPLVFSDLFEHMLGMATRTVR